MYIYYCENRRKKTEAPNLRASTIKLNAEMKQFCFNYSQVPTVQDQDISEPPRPPLCDGDYDLGLAKLMKILEIMDVKGLT